MSGLLRHSISHWRGVAGMAAVRLSRGMGAGCLLDQSISKLYASEQMAGELVTELIQESLLKIDFNE